MKEGAVGRAGNDASRRWKTGEVTTAKNGGNTSTTSPAISPLVGSVNKIGKTTAAREREQRTDTYRDQRNPTTWALRKKEERRDRGQCGEDEKPERNHIGGER